MDRGCLVSPAYLVPIAWFNLGVCVCNELPRKEFTRGWEWLAYGLQLNFDVKRMARRDQKRHLGYCNVRG